MTTKAHILELALRAADRRRRQRRFARASGVAAVLLVAGGSLLWALATPAPDETSPDLIANPSLSKPVTPPPSVPAVTVIAAGPLRHVNVISHDPGLEHVTWLDDTQLLDTLADAGLDAGLAYHGDRAFLLPRGWTLHTTAPGDRDDK
ncbi:MAG: hypothetical protein AAGD32_08710 [Planctomycetota bacterium]